jgi:NAD dependent epimerase/dehydratase
MAKKVLVTGAAGFIGSHLVEFLLEKGYDVRAMIRYSSQTHVGNLHFLGADKLRQIELVKGDLKDPEFCNTAVKDCEYIFHLGALIAIPYSYINPTDFVQTNIEGTVNMLNAARRSDCLSRFIHTSTSEVYGTAVYTPIDERHPLQPQSPYSASKIGADNMVKSYMNSFDLPITIIRPFNTFGPRQSARAVIPTIISQLVKNNEVKLGSLEPKRDFLFVKDTVAGFHDVGTHPNTKGETLNLGTGYTITIGDLYAKICGIMGRQATLLQDTSRIRPEKSEVMHLEASTEHSKALTGWAPNYGIDRGLEITVDWIRQNIHLFNPDIYNV